MSEQPEVVRRQRVAAYAICLRERRILLSQLSDRTGWPGLWTLPGGGIDHGEDPKDAVVREVYEETGYVLERGPLLEVDSRHFQGQGLNGLVEDFHSIRLIYAGAIRSTDEPRVIEVDGSTARAAWVDLAELANLETAPLIGIAVQALETLRR